MKRNKIILFACAAAVVAVCALLSAFVIQLAVIDGDSMKPTYHSIEFVLINKTEKEYSVGDVVAVKLKNGRTVVKRIAAAPKDSIQIVGGTVTVNGGTSAFYKDVRAEYAGIAEEKIVLGEGEYFLLGDNISESRDSRYADVGIISEESVIGIIIPQKNNETQN